MIRKNEHQLVFKLKYGTVLGNRRVAGTTVRISGQKIQSRGNDCPAVETELRTGGS